MVAFGAPIRESIVSMAKESPHIDPLGRGLIGEILVRYLYNYVSITPYTPRS